MKEAISCPAGALGVSLTAVRKSFGSVVAVHDVSLDIPAGQIVSLLGPSGCGKTTTLRMIAGLEHPDSGGVQIGGTLVNDIPPWKRNIGMMFQNYALFPHLTVSQNIAYGLRMRRVARAQIQAAVAETMAQVRLTGMGERYPSQLSGGQRQRVALARAIITRPSLLLLDEPLAALDRKLREQMQVEIKLLQRELKTTMIFVTHDQEEALALSDVIVVMENGRVVQVGTPVEVYENPQSRFVSDFIGTTNVMKGRVTAVEGDRARIETESGDILYATLAGSCGVGEAVELVVRPERVSVQSINGDGVASGRNAIRGTIVHVVYTGAVTHFHVATQGGPILVAMLPNTSASRIDVESRVGESVVLRCQMDDILIFPRGAHGDDLVSHSHT